MTIILYLKEITDSKYWNNIETDHHVKLGSAINYILLCNLSENNKSCTISTDKGYTLASKNTLYYINCIKHSKLSGKKADTFKVLESILWSLLRIICTPLLINNPPFNNSDNILNTFDGILLSQDKCFPTGCRVDFMFPEAEWSAKSQSALSLHWLY